MTDLIHDEAAERALIAVALVDEGETLNHVADLIRADDFYLPAHQAIWRAMCAVRVDGAYVDAETVAAELRDMQRFEMIGGAAYLDGLLRVPAVPHPGEYAGRVARLARRRAVCLSARLAFAAANDPAVADEVIADRIGSMQSAWECGTDELPTWTGGEIERMTFPDEPEWLIDGWWEWEACGFIAGSEKSSKTVLTMGAALSVATGKPWLGRFPVHQCRVLFIAEEDHVRRVQRRMRKLARALDLPWPTDEIRFAPQQGCNITSDRGRGRVSGAVRKHKPGWLVLDPFRQMTPGLEERDSGEVAEVLAWVRGIQHANHCAVSIIDHLRKDPQAAPDQGRAEHQLRGSGAKGAWRDSFIFIKRKNEESPEHKIKALHRDGAPLPWQIVNVTWDEPAKGDLVIESHEAPKTAKNLAGTTPSGQPRTAYAPQEEQRSVF